VRAASLVEAGLNRICLSMDSLSEDVFRDIREGGEVQDMEKAFAALRKARTMTGRELQIGVEFVVMRDNAHELPEVVRWAAKQGASFAIVTHLLPYDAEHAKKIAYDLNSEQALAFFQEWQERAERRRGWTCRPTSRSGGIICGRRRNNGSLISLRLCRPKAELAAYRFT
jgi:molybdenum cofactor biosynthesis enzyme MoaA